MPGPKPVIKPRAVKTQTRRPGEFKRRSRRRISSRSGAFCPGRPGTSRNLRRGRVKSGSTAAAGKQRQILFLSVGTRDVREGWAPRGPGRGRGADGAGGRSSPRLFAGNGVLCPEPDRDDLSVRQRPWSALTTTRRGQIRKNELVFQRSDNRRRLALLMAVSSSSARRMVSFRNVSAACGGGGRRLSGETHGVSGN